MTENEVAKETPEQDNTENGNAEEESELETKIINQVEYYFGDLNLPRDKFLCEQVKLDDGWVPLEVLITFNRLAKLTTDLEAIAKALNKSTTGLVEVSEDNKKVRRNPELLVPEMNEERRKELMSRTIYAKGFPKDSVLDVILEFFKVHPEVETVVMRKYLDKQTKKRIFKGSVFATFKTKEQAEKFLENKGLKFGETELITRWQEEYLKEKQEEYIAKKEKREKKSKEQEEKKERPELKLPTGTILHVTTTDTKVTREKIKEALTDIGAEVAYIDFKVGDTEGWVRLSKENAAKEIMEKITDNKLKIGETEATIKQIVDEEETAYLEKTVSQMLQNRKNARNNRHNSRGGNFKGKNNKYQNKKRKQDSHADAPPSKVKAES